MQIIEIRHLWPSFNDLAIINFSSFIAMTLIITRKTITVVLGTIALQLIGVFQCGASYSINKQVRFFDCCNAFIDFIVCDCSFYGWVQYF